MQTSTPDQIRATVRQVYGMVATEKPKAGCCGGGTSCCRPTGSSSTRLGYSDADLAAVPEGADLGLGCGNPQAIAGLAPGAGCWTWGAVEDSMRSSPRARSVLPEASSAWT